MKTIITPAILMLALLLLSGGCIKFDNAAEESDGSGGNQTPSGASIDVEVTGVDNRATVVVVELVWYEGGGEGDTRYMRMAEPSLTGTLNVSFEGLPAGSGYAQAGTFIGNIPWQGFGKSIRLEIGEDLEPRSVSISLSDPDGDIDLDFEFTVEDYQEIDTGEVTETDSGENLELEESEYTDNEGEDDYEDSFRPIIFVPYSPISMIPDGVVDPLDEWTFAETYQFETYHQWPTTVYIMHDTRYIYIGMIINNVPSSDEGDDRARVYFDLDPINEGNAFNLYVTKKQGTKGCDPVDLNSCLDLPYGQPVWDAETSLFADGYQVEMMVSFQSLGLLEGEPKRMGFASASQDNGYLHFWPEGSLPEDLDTWGYIDSLDDWGEHYYPDGDEEVDEDIDFIDSDEEDGDIEGSDTADGDDDLDPDPDNADTDTDAISCTPNDTVCVLELGVYKAKTCNGSGNGWDLIETCVDDNDCTDNSCQAHTGCQYPILEYFECDDENPCTTEDYCDLDGKCTGELVECVDDNPCTIDWQNPENPECCQHDWKDPGAGCDDGLICTSGTSCQPVSVGSEELECVGSSISGCCEGRPGMAMTSAGVCIDKYEAVAVNSVYYNYGACNGGGGTRYGLGVDDYGSAGLQDNGTTTGQTLYACQIAQIIPSTYLTKLQAQTLCTNAGKRLCGEDEWESICSNIDVNTYPYGDTYQSAYCNGADFNPSNDNVVQTGLLTQCVAPGSVIDLSGNVQEWTGDVTLCGGSSVSNSFEMTCTSCIAPPENGSLYFSGQTGFRCCAAPVYP